MSRSSACLVPGVRSRYPGLHAARWPPSGRPSMAELLPPTCWSCTTCLPTWRGAGRSRRDGRQPHHPLLSPCSPAPGSCWSGFSVINPARAGGRVCAAQSPAARCGCHCCQSCKACTGLRHACFRAACNPGQHHTCAAHAVHVVHAVHAVQQALVRLVACPALGTDPVLPCSWAESSEHAHRPAQAAEQPTRCGGPAGQPLA